MRTTSLALVALTFAACAPPIDDSAVGSRREAIVGGTTDSGDPAVVLVIAYDPKNQNGGESFCTGEVISPHVVLTAAHCVDPATVGAGMSFLIFVGSDINNSTQANDNNNYYVVKETHYNTAFNMSNLQGGNDTAVVITQNALPAKPIPYAHSLPPAAQGQTVRLIGYGIDSGSDTQGTSAGTKRQTMTQITTVYTNFLYFGDGQHETCEGDSGGPALLPINGVETIVGITSFGDQGCTMGGYDTRVDYYDSWIDPYVAADTGQPPPDMSQPPPDMSHGGSSDMAQPHNDDQGTTQQGGQDGGTSYPPGSVPVGDACSSHGDCASGVCAFNGATGYCTQPCDPMNTSSCPGHLVCGEIDGQNYCVRPISKGGGCTVAGSDPSTFAVFALAIAALALVGLRRRRRA